MDRHHGDADPDPTFHFDADADPDPTPRFTHVGKSEICFTLIQSSASLRCFIFLVGVLEMSKFSIFGTKPVFWNFMEKVKFRFTFDWKGYGSEFDSGSAKMMPIRPDRTHGTAILYLKVLTNEKRGGLKVVIFDRSSFKLFLLWFSNKSMKAPSCEGPKTTQRSLFFSFASNSCFPASDEKLLAVFELMLEDFYDSKTIIRYCSKRLSCLFVSLAHFFRFITDLWNNAKVTTAVLLISVKYFCRSSKHRADC